MKSIRYNPLTGEFEEVGSSEWEENDWRYALQSNTKHWYARYLKDYPNGKYRAEAQQKIQQLEQKGKD